jgi:hypothetical protein
VPANAEFRDLTLEKFSKSGERFIVCCASPYLERPVATICLILDFTSILIEAAA